MKGTISKLALELRVSRLQGMPPRDLNESRKRIEESLRVQTEKAQILTSITKMSEIELVDYIFDLKEQIRVNNTE
ncbi:hypothetical protein [Vibrio harveyi]|uniref:hypothetical protein n=1 Tax=Vibrio harveyi TaxID=669 RepID=UPI003CEE3A3D